MSVRCPLKGRILFALALLLVLSLIACSPFGRGKEAKEAPTAAPTATSLPAQPPAPAQPLVTPTPTVTPVPPTATPTPTTAATEEEAVAAEQADTGATVTTPTAEAETAAVTAPTVQATVVVPARQVTSAVGNLVDNGSFEEGFDQNGVAQGWTAFSTPRDGAVYAWQDETDRQGISHGDHAQLMRIMGPGKADQYVGIYQTVEVVSGQSYTLKLHGLIRSSTSSDDACPCDGDEDNPFAFRFQYAVVDGGAVDWRTIEGKNWIDPGWNDVGLDAEWPGMNAYVVPITPQSDLLTLYIRGWSKWPLFQEEAKFYVDGVFLEGPMPATTTAGPAGGGTGPAGGGAGVTQEAAEVPSTGLVELPTTGGDPAGVIAIGGAILILVLAIWQVRKTWMR